MRERGRGCRSAGLVPGLILMVVGAAMILDQQQVIGLGRVWQLWPLILVAYGLAALASRSPDRIFIGCLMTIMGVLFLAIHFGWWGLSMRQFAPLAVLGTGLSFIARALFGRSRSRDDAAPGGAS